MVENALYCPTCHRKSLCPESDETSRCEHCESPLLLRQRWWLGEMLGHGASGYTWKAVDAEDGSVVAIKELSFRRLTDLKQLELFEREAQALASLDHRAVPDFIEQFVVEEDRFVSAYLVQEFIDGGVVEVGPHTDEEEVLRFLEEMADVLEYLHSRRPPVIHRDIKPSNVMRRRDGSYVLIDFGAIRASVEATTGGSTVAGTLGYMAPEQLLGRASAGSDFYGLGATALALLAGRQAHELIEHHRPDRWRSQVEVSEKMTGLLSALLVADVSDRIKTAAALRQEIRKVRNPRRPETTRIPPELSAELDRKGRKRRRRKRRLWRAPLRRTAVSWTMLVLLSAGVSALIFLSFFWVTPWLYVEAWARLVNFGSTFVWEMFFLLLITAMTSLIFISPAIIAWNVLGESSTSRHWLVVPGSAVVSLLFVGWMIVGLAGSPPHLHVIQKGEETRFIAQFSCGFSIIDESGRMVRFFHYRSRNCSSSLVDDRFLLAGSDAGFAYLDAWSGEIYFDLARELPAGEEFRVTEVDEWEVVVQLQDGGTQRVGIHLPDEPFEARISSPLSTERALPPTDLHRAAVIVPDECGHCSDCGPVVTHFTTAFGDGHRMVSGLDGEGRAMWTIDRPSRDFFDFESAHDVGGQCWLYVPRRAGVTEVLRLDRDRGSLERAWRF